MRLSNKMLTFESSRVVGGRSSSSNTGCKVYVHNSNVHAAPVACYTCGRILYRRVSDTELSTDAYSEFSVSY